MFELPVRKLATDFLEHGMRPISHKILGCLIHANIIDLVWIFAIALVKHILLSVCCNGHLWILRTKMQIFQTMKRNPENERVVVHHLVGVDRPLLELRSSGGEDRLSKRLYGLCDIKRRVLSSVGGVMMCTAHCELVARRQQFVVQHKLGALLL